MRSKVVLTLMVVALLGVACAGRSYSSQPGDAISMEKMVESEAGYTSGESAPAMDTNEDYGGSAGPVGEDLPRMILYNGNLALVVKDTNQTQEDIVALIEGMEGYVVNVSSYAYGGGLMNISLTVRVPAAAFNAAMASIRNMALEISSENVGSQDVTQEYVDLESRLHALEVKATRLEELMEAAEDTEAVLAVYQELSQTQQDIEQTKGRMQYLERSAAMATIDIQLTPDELSKPVEIAGWRPAGTIKRAIEALIKTFQFLIDLLMWLVLYVVPILLFTGVVLFIVLKFLGLIFGGKRRKKEGTQPVKKD
ncbi:MAG: DUF4349 domain-containing protein [Anaerolineales bacterium]|nr:MAG: DUF4349 domain-containing protein [Anaerolineales bacterium]